ncbi:amino acid ABC transporter substrate-binding protein [Polaromonas sp.]|uniref:amino acid ABC transporter substrate-binding protein n=1 Tax=Polaromonas sp. TaxID=1869339 RepID=UPI003C99F2EB
MAIRMHSTRRWMVPLVLVLMAVPPASAQATFDKVKSRSQLVVGYRENAFPFSFADGKGAAGYSIDLCAPIIERIGQASSAKNLRVVYQAVEQERVVSLLKSGVIDLMCANTSDTDARRKLVAFSPPIFYAAVRVLVRSSDKLGSLDQLAGKNLVVLGGTTARNALNTHAASQGLKWKIANVLEHDAAMSQLSLRQADGYVRDDILLVNAVLTAKNPADFVLLPERLSSEPIAIVYRSGDPALQKLVDLSIVESMRSGKFSQTYEKWFVKPAPPANKALNLPMSPELSRLLAAAR